MRYLCLLILSLLPLTATAAEKKAENVTALGALDMLPKEELKRLVRIDAFDGNPLPDRWHILVHDPNTRTGVREYVVAGGELVTSRAVSQFAESLKETDIIGSEGLKVDADGLAELARDFATANEIPITSVSYHLYKSPAESAEPVWRVNCLNAEGKAIGELVVTATNGSVMSHVGFPLRPEKSAKALAAARGAEEDDEDDNKKRSSPSASSSSRKKSTASASKRSSGNKSRASSSRNSSRREARRYAAEAPERIIVRPRRTNPIGNFFRKIFR